MRGPRAAALVLLAAILGGAPLIVGCASRDAGEPIPAYVVVERPPDRLAGEITRVEITTAADNLDPAREAAIVASLPNATATLADWRTRLSPATYRGWLHRTTVILAGPPADPAPTSDAAGATIPAARPVRILVLGGLLRQTLPATVYNEPTSPDAASDR